MTINKSTFSSVFSSDFTRSERIAAIILLIIVVTLSLLLPIFIANDSLYRVDVSKEYKVGELADEDVIANEDYSFIDEVETANNKEKAIEAIPPRFTYSLSQSTLMEKNASDIVSAFQSGKDAVLAISPSFIDIYKMYEELSIQDRNRALLLIEDAVRYFIVRGVFSLDDIYEVKKEGYNKITTEMPNTALTTLSVKEGSIDSLITDETLYPFFLAWLQDYSISFSSQMIYFIYEVVDYVITSNMVYDEMMTEELRRAAGESVAPVTISVEKGDYIIRHDTIVTASDLRLIEKINSSTYLISPWQLLGRVIFLLILCLTSVLAFFYLMERKYRVSTYVLMYLSSTIIVILTTAVLLVNAGYLSPYADQILPIFFVPLFITELTSRKRYGFIAGVYIAAVMMFLPSSSFLTFFYYVFMIEITLLFVRFGVNRIDMIYQAFYSAIAAAVITLFFHLIQGRAFNLLPTEVILIVLNVAITYMLMSIVLPLIEHFFNIPTVFRLHELCSTDTAILSKLRSQAPGTYNHVNNVSDMAYLAAKEIGANAELARVGGLYHDIGKAEHPEYFIENQGGGHNIHDDMKVTLSAAVIKSHVKLGVEKGREIGLPQEVIDIIDQHHGTDVIQYFYNEALKEAQNSKVPYQVNEEDFKYNGDIPQTREAAIVMLADCFEAASRTLKKPTNQRYEKLITSIIVSKINHGQLNDSHLTMTDLETIKTVFIHEALGRDHQRIEYTDQVKEKSHG